MSRENVEILQRANALLNTGDWHAILKLDHQDIELRDLQHAPDMPEVLRGADAMNLVVANRTGLRRVRVGAH
jgi:hypothetical protein